jgi:transcription elongation factor GreA
MHSQVVAATPLIFLGENMAAVKAITLTKDGFEHLKSELKELKEVKRPEVIERIRRAKEFGDLSENAEYQTAKEDQSFIEGRIQEIEAMIKNAKIIAKKESSSTVSIGSTVKVSLDGTEITYEIVGPTESDIEHNKVSSDSPVGRGLLGHQKGETVTISVPGGDMQYKILEVK